MPQCMCHFKVPQYSLAFVCLFVATTIDSHSNPFRISQEQQHSKFLSLAMLATISIRQRLAFNIYRVTQK